jgi:hypothetical protein
MYEVDTGLGRDVGELDSRRIGGLLHGARGRDDRFDRRLCGRLAVGDPKAEGPDSYDRARDEKRPSKRFADDDIVDRGRLLLVDRL